MPERPDQRPEPVVVIEDLSEHGLLWLINASVFHPRGFALGWSPSARHFEISGDGTERFAFTEDYGSETADTDDKFHQVEELFRQIRAVHATQRAEEA